MNTLRLPGLTIPFLRLLLAKTEKDVGSNLLPLLRNGQNLSPLHACPADKLTDLTLLLSCLLSSKTSASTDACATGSARYVRVIQCSSLPRSTFVMLDLCLVLFNAFSFSSFCLVLTIFLTVLFIFYPFTSYSRCLIPYFPSKMGCLNVPKHIIIIIAR